MALLTKGIQNSLIKEFADLERNVKLIFFTQEFECSFCSQTRELLEKLSTLSDRITLEIFDFQKDTEEAKHYQIDKIPAIVMEGTRDYGIRFFGIPSGYEFSSLIEDIMVVSKDRTDLTDETRQQLKKLSRPVHIQVFVSVTCPYCPRAVSLAHKLAYESDSIRADMVEISEFAHLAHKYDVFSVPKVVINEVIQFEGALPEPAFVAKVMEAVKKKK